MKTKTKVVTFSSLAMLITVLLALLIAKNKQIASMKAKERERQTHLWETVKDNPDEMVRWRTVGYEIKDQTLLLGIAKNDSSVQVRGVAVSRLDDQKLLAEFASNYQEHLWIRTAALRKLTNQSVLAKIAKNDEDVCMEAFSNLTDQALLRDIVKNSSNRVARAYAVRNLNDKAFLLDIAQNSSCLWARVSAAEKLGDKALFEKLEEQRYQLKRKEEHQKRDLVWETAKITDQSVLADWAKNHEYPEVRQAAESRLNELTK